jgi:hypothetical protein
MFGNDGNFKSVYGNSAGLTPFHCELIYRMEKFIIPTGIAAWFVAGASLKCRSCRKGRHAPPLRMIKLTRPIRVVKGDLRARLI